MRSRRCGREGPARRVLLRVLSVVPLAELATGFGAGVMLAIPLRAHKGFAPGTAAGLAPCLVAVPWGAVAARPEPGG